MDLFAAAFCMALAVLHQVIAFDRQYSGISTLGTILEASLFRGTCHEMGRFRAWLFLRK